MAGAGPILTPITAILPVYNSARTLGRTLESLKGKVSRFIAADGWYKTRNEVSRHPFISIDSNDGTREMVEGFPNGYWLPSPPESYHVDVDKLNRLLEISPNGWVFWIEDDEVLVGDIEKLPETIVDCDIIPIKKVEKTAHNYAGDHWYAARLFYNRPGVKFFNHWTLTYPDGRVAVYMGTTPDNCYIEHWRL